MIAHPLLLIAAGGTGGHMFPAQALAEEMITRGWRVTLSTDARGSRYAGGFPPVVEHQVVKASSFSQGGLASRLATPFIMTAGMARAIWDMRRDRPVCVAGFGGYPSLPAMAAATALRIPRLIHEQNGVLGRVNKLFAGSVDAVACGTWPTELPEGVNAVHTGNPVRRAVLEAREAYAAPAEGPINLLVIGGSQGAGLFSRVVPDALRRLPFDLRDRIRLTQQVRPEDMKRVQATYAEMEIDCELRGFFQDIPARMARAHLIVARAGAASVAEIAAMGRPAILIPYAAAMDDHQSANARGLVAAGGAFSISEDALTGEVLAGHITEILSDPEGAEAMAAASRSAARADATTALADLIERISQGQNTHERTDPSSP